MTTKYTVSVCRTSYGFCDIEIEAVSLQEAEATARDISGDQSYSEKVSEYEIVQCYITPEPTPYP